MEASGLLRDFALETQPQGKGCQLSLRRDCDVGAQQLQDQQHTACAHDAAAAAHTPFYQQPAMGVPGSSSYYGGAPLAPMMQQQQPVMMQQQAMQPPLMMLLPHRPQLQLFEDVEFGLARALAGLTEQQGGQQQHALINWYALQVSPVGGSCSAWHCLHPGGLVAACTASA